MNRRSVLRTLGLGLMASRIPLGRKDAKAAATEARRCRIVVFGADGLRQDAALRMWREGAPGLSSLERPVGSLSGGGQSVTQPGWIDIWTGLPAAYHGFVKNGDRGTIPQGIHIMGKLMDELAGDDFHAVWIVAKGVGLLDGEDPQSPHHPVYERIVLQGNPGVYVGDKSRSDAEIFARAYEALQEAVLHRNYCCFVHFHNPDVAGHRWKDPDLYSRAALGVDRYIHRLMQLLPQDCRVLYCSDHGFNFTKLGEVEDSHGFAPRGMVATSFPTRAYHNVSRPTVGRWIYRLAGGDPEHCVSGFGRYAMYGLDI